MTRLAPDIIKANLDGRQPRHLNLHAMRGRQGEVPLDWGEQRCNGPSRNTPMGDALATRGPWHATDSLLPSGWSATGKHAWRCPRH